jgi:MFS family permease
MSKWLVRALVFAAAMVVLRVIQGVLVNAFEAHSGLISMLLLLMFVIAVLVWGLFDGRSDAEANPDPDRRRDLATTWLVAGLVAGLIGGAVAWLVSLVDKAIYVGSLINELTTFAAFTALLVFVPAMGGAMVGRWVQDRKHAKEPQRHHGLAADEEGEGRADTDVFAAVGASGESDALAADGAATQTSAAPAGSEAPTEEFPRDAGEATSRSEATTDEIRRDAGQTTSRSDVTTDEIRYDDR